MVIVTGFPFQPALPIEADRAARGTSMAMSGR
jgi:hypothetical protein